MSNVWFPKAIGLVFDLEFFEAEGAAFLALTFDDLLFLSSSTAGSFRAFPVDLDFVAVDLVAAGLISGHAN